MIRLNVYRLAIACLAVVFAKNAMAQTSSVELLGTVTAAQAGDGLGFNLDPGVEWQWAAAAAAGATHARIQCSWDAVEQQTAPPDNQPASVQYIEAPACAQALTYAAKYGISPTIVAGYGAPYHQILSVTVPEGAAVGASTFTIQFANGVGGDTFAKLKVPYDYFCPAAQSPAAQTPPIVCASYPTATGGVEGFTPSGSPEGALISGITLIDSTHATISLASAIRFAIPASNSALYNISEILYPATLTERATDPSVIAFGNYVSFLASDVAAHGLKGDIEIWNEPPHTSDPWDNACLLYDADLAATCLAVPGAAPDRYEPNYAFVANLQTKPMPAGVTVTWNGTSGSGWASVLGPRMLNQSAEALEEPSTTVTRESFHPYGFEPEQTNWTVGCLEATVTATTKAAQQSTNCYLPGEPTNSNFAYAAQLDMIAKASNPSFGIGHEITETGIVPPVAGLEVPQARFVVRQFLAFQADGITPVNFFKLYDDNSAVSDPSFSFVEEAGNTSAYTAKPSFTALSGLMADIQPISNAPPAAYSAQTLPSVGEYTGTFPLSTVHLVGARSGETANSDAFMVWQRSFTPCSTASVCGVWITQASPAAAPVTINVPASMKVTQVVNLTTRDLISYTSSANTISFLVADDPIEVLTDPTSSSATSTLAQPTSMSLSTSSASSTYGEEVVLTATLTPYKTTSNSTNGESVIFLNGTTQLGVGSLVSGIATLHTTSISAGTNTILAKYAGDSHFIASAGFSTVHIAKANPVLVMPSIPSQTWGSPNFTVTPSTNSPGNVTVTLVSGPAGVSANTITGATVSLNQVGTVVLGATQNATPNFNAAPLVTTTFVILGKAPSITFESFAAKTYGNAPFPIKAESSSHGIITYSVVSGAASVSGNTVTLTGPGTVVIRASQPANGNYLAATANLSFVVAPKPGALTFNAIPNQTYGGAAVPLSTTSISTGAVTYYLVSGPGAVQNNTVSLSGVGTVVVGANQAASGSQAAQTATTSFVVNAAKPTVVFDSFAAKTFGDLPFLVTAESASGGAFTYSVVSGPAAFVGNLLTLTGGGPVVIQASQAASGNYLAATANLSFAVAMPSGALTVSPIPNQIYGVAPIALSATSASSGPIKFSIVSGPARIDGNTALITGVGTVVVGASQTGSGSNAVPQTATTSFVVNPATPVLAFEWFAPKYYGNVPFPVKAESKSHGIVTMSVIQGPGTFSGDMLSLSGAGTVIVQANQPAQGNYLATTAILSIPVAKATPQLTIAPIPTQTYGVASVTIQATSASPGALTYSVVSGPATIDGNKVIITGTGTVIVGASQAATADYSEPTTVTRSFLVRG